MATVRTEGLRGPLAKGLTVTSNDPEQPTLQLTVRVKVQGSVQLLPGSHISLSMREGAPEARVLVRKEPDEQGALEVTDVVASAPWLKASARKLAAPEEILGFPATAAGDWIVEVRPEGPLAEGQSLQQVQFKTGLRREPVVTVLINVFIPPLLTLSSPSLLLPAPAPGRPAEGTLLAFVRADVDPSGIKIETDPPGLEAQLEEAGPGPRKIRIKVSWMRRDSDRQSEGLVTLKAAGQSFQLPVRITVPSGAQGS